MNDAKLIKKHAAQHDLFNRLHSIASDERFVRKVAEDWFDNRFEVIANQRCGSWYCDPSTSSSVYAYFKSTDGHTNNWDFNLRRSNLPLATHAEKCGGFILVDSTRRGKRMPDGLSKTVPIWCCVVNRALKRRWTSKGTPIPDNWDTGAYLPGQIVSPSERAQIEDKLDGWADDLEGSVLPLPDLTKPLRPFFIHPSTSVPPEIPTSPDYTPIICVSASRWVNEGRDVIPTATRLGDGMFSRTVAFDYVPGAGDDDELWGRGLSASLFHAQKKDLLSTPREDLPDLVDQLVEDVSIPMNDLSLDTATFDSATPIKPGFYLDLGSPCRAPQGPKLSQNHLTLRVVEVNKPPKNVPFILRASNTDSSFIAILPAARSQPKEHITALCVIEEHLKTHLSGMDLLVTPGRKDELDAAIQWFESGYQKEKGPKITFISADKLPPSELQGARKFLIPLAVALLCSLPTFSTGEIDKAAVANHLHQLVSLWPDGNPPRAALKRVNEFLMSDDR